MPCLRLFLLSCLPIRFLTCLVCIAHLPFAVSAQTPQQVPVDTSHQPQTFQIRDILIEGNQKTRDFVILREMHIGKGDTVLARNLTAELEKARVFIYNSTLFSEVNIYPLKTGQDQIDLLITVKEKWYLLPLPVLELADRSINEWLKTYHADLKRLSYGISFTHQNFSGRRDQLSLTLVNGFNRRISFQYKNPYINRRLTKGLEFGASLAEAKEIPYITSDSNKLVYYENGGREKREYSVFAGYTFRKGLKTKGTFSARYTHVRVADTIVNSLNPQFFKNAYPTQSFIDLEYALQYDDVDNVLYPLRGSTFDMQILKRGLGFEKDLHFISLGAGFSRYFTHNRNWYTSIRLSGEVKLPFDQPYYNTRALGYGSNYLRGYEYHVMDGVAFALAKFDLKKKVASFSLPSPVLRNIAADIPFTIYAKTYVDAGWVHNERSSLLGNRFLYSGGIGVDIVTLFDLKISLELSMNQLGQKGVFLHN